MRAVARLLAAEVGQYAVIDRLLDEAHSDRIAIAHADPSKHQRLRVARVSPPADPRDRLRRVIASRGGERIASFGASRAKVADLVMPDEAPIQSYLAHAVVAGDVAWGVVSLLSTSSAVTYTETDAALLASVSAWCGLAIEAAQAREGAPPASGERERYAPAAPTSNLRSSERRGSELRSARSATRPR